MSGSHDAEIPGYEQAEAMVRALKAGLALPSRSEIAIINRAEDPYGGGDPSPIPSPKNDAEKGEAVPEPGFDKFPGEFIPIPLNKRNVQRTLQAQINKKNPVIRRWLVATWNAQAEAIKFGELSEAISSGQFPESWLVTWQEEYSAMVADHLDPLWREEAGLSHGLMEAGISKVVSSAPTWAAIQSRVEAWVDARGVELALKLTTNQQLAMKAILRHYTVDIPIGPRELGRFLRAVTPLTPAQAGAVSKFRDNLIEGGLSVKLAEKRVQTYAGFLRRLRAETIARTEVAFAFNRGGLDTVRQAKQDGDLVGRVVKVYMTALDGRVDDWCAPLHGTVVGLEQTWPGPSKRTPYVLTPPVHVNCRCSIVYHLLAPSKKTARQLRALGVVALSVEDLVALGFAA